MRFGESLSFICGFVPNALAFSNDGLQLGALCSVSYPPDWKKRMENEDIMNLPDSGVCVWSVPTGELITWRPASFPTVTADGGHSWDSLFVVGDSVDAGAQILLDPATGEERVRIVPKGMPSVQNEVGRFLGPQTHLKPAPGGKYFAVDEFDNDIGQSFLSAWLKPLIAALGSSDDPRFVLRLYNADGKLQASLPGQQFACYSSDGMTMATVSLEESIVSVWDLPPRRPWPYIRGGAGVPVVLIAVLRWLITRRSPFTRA